MIFLFSNSVAVAQTQKQSLIKISKETTWIESPIGKDGFVDYEAWINQRYGEGLKADQNALVDLLKIFGPGEMDEQVAKMLLQRLQLKEFPEAKKKYRFARDYLLAAGGTPDQLKKVKNPMEAMMIRMMAEMAYHPPTEPWNREDHAEVAKWLDEMGDTLEEVAVALESKEVYVPIMLDYEGPISPFKVDLLFGFERNVLEKQYLCEDFIVRAMYHLGLGQLDECERYLLATRRLTLLLGDYPFAKYDRDALDGLIAYFSLFNAECTFARHPAVTADRILKYRAKMKMLVSPDFMLKGNEFGLRIEILHRITRAARWREGDRQWAIDDGLTNLLSESEIKPDWNAALTITNELMDRVAKALKTADYTEAKKLYDKFLADRDPTKVAEQDSPAEMKMARQIVAAMLPFSLLLISESRDYHVCETTADMYLAIWAYKKDHGSFPDTLKQLPPKYCDAVGTDTYSGKEIIYRRWDEEFVIYSVGPDGKDELQTRPLNPKEIFANIADHEEVHSALLGIGSRVYAKDTSKFIRRIFESQKFGE